MPKKLKIGDYVLATKYSDGDPHDHFVIGFFNGMTNHNHPRFNVVDSGGADFRHNGFRRCEKISKEIGDILVQAIKTIELASANVWYWRYHPKQLERIHNIYPSNHCPF